MLPRWLEVWPVLTPLAIIMLGAAVNHMRSRETLPGLLKGVMVAALR